MKDIAHDDRVRDLSGLVTIPRLSCQDATTTSVFGEVYKAVWSDINPRSNRLLKKLRLLCRPNEKIVAIKVIRPPIPEGHRELIGSRLKREIDVWHRLNHENILPILGISYDFGAFPSIISPWQSNGIIMSFLENNRDADRYELLRGIACGLDFLHNQTPNIVHGNLKPDNILINHFGRPYLSGFGFSAIYNEGTAWKKALMGTKGTTRYLSPELMDSNVRMPTKAGDVYAYALICWEVMTGMLSFHDYVTEEDLLPAICERDERPERPLPASTREQGWKSEAESAQEGSVEAEPVEKEEASEITEARISDALWGLITECWAREPTNRPPTGVVLKKVTAVCRDEHPLRLLSIDGGGISILNSLVTLKNLMEEIGPNAKPCEYFDMIAGSETGGVVALMLGRLRLSVEECAFSLIEPFQALYDVPIDKQNDRVLKGKYRFPWYAFDNAFRPIINAKVGEEERALPDLRNDLCRTFVAARAFDTERPIRIRTYSGPNMETFPHRIWVAMGATMCTELNFKRVFGEKTSLAGFDNHVVGNISPSLQLLDEARKVFGTHRRVAAFVSLGNGLSTRLALTLSKSTNEGNIDGLPDRIPEPLMAKLRKQAVVIEAIEAKTRRFCEPGTFYRFDPAEFLLRGGINSLASWQETFVHEQIHSDDVPDATQMYLTQVARRQLEECANRLIKATKAR